MTDEPTSSASNRALSARIGKLERLAEGHERNASDAARVLTEVLGRVANLETDRQERRIAEAATAVKDEQLKQDVHEIKKFITNMQEGNIIGKVKDMSTGFNRLFWLVIGALVTGGIGLLFLAMRGAL